MSIENFDSSKADVREDSARNALVHEFLGQAYISPDQTGMRAAGDANPPEYQSGLWATGDALPNGNQTTLQRVPNNFPQFG